MLHTRRIGACTVANVVEYFGPTHDPAALFPDFDPQVLEANRDWLVPDHWVPHMDRLVIAIQIWIVHAGADIVVIDAGVGNRKPRTAARMNMLNTLVPQWMEAAGAPRAKVTHVVTTHLHGDHIGWNTVLEDGRWVPTFPNAKYFLPKADFAFFKERFERDRAANDSVAFADSVLPVLDAGLVRFIGHGDAVADCLEVESAPGHTPGQIILRLRSRGEEGVFSADIMHHPIQIVRPSWNTAFCVLPDDACRTRSAFLETAAASSALVMPCHFGPPHCGYVRKEADRYRFERPAER